VVGYTDSPKEQTGFIKGMLFLDNIIIAWEGVEWTKGNAQKARF
jgi:hypothetical protein